MAVLRLLALAFCAALAAGRAAPSRHTGMIHGRLAFGEAFAPESRRPAVSDLGSSAHEPIDRRRSVVYLESAPRQAFDELGAGHARMDQRDEQFAPRVLAVTVGTVVDFPNNDTKFHNVFSLSRTKTFDLGRYPPGHAGSVRFDRPGIVQVFCDIHSHMRGYILVFSHPFFAVTDDSGRYAIAGAPAGVYTLVVWSELGRADPRTITVTDGGVTEADFKIGGTP